MSTEIIKNAEEHDKDVSLTWNLQQTVIALNSDFWHVILCTTIYL